MNQPVNTPDIAFLVAPLATKTELVTVPATLPATKQNLVDAAVEAADKLNRGFEGVYAARFERGTTANQKWLIKHQSNLRGYLVSGIAGGIVATEAGVMAVMGTPSVGVACGALALTALTAVLAGVLAARPIVKKVEGFRDAAERRGAQLQSDEIQPVTDALRDMSQEELATIGPQLRALTTERVDSGRLSPHAREAILRVKDEAHVVSGPAHERAWRASRLREGLPYSTKDRDVDAWFDRHSKLLHECEPQERAEIATELITRYFYADESCKVWQLNAAQAGRLYELLTTARKLAAQQVAESQ